MAERKEQEVRSDLDRLSPSERESRRTFSMTMRKKQELFPCSAAAAGECWLVLRRNNWEQKWLTKKKVQHYRQKKKKKSSMMKQICVRFQLEQRQQIVAVVVSPQIASLLKPNVRHKSPRLVADWPHQGVSSSSSWNGNDRNTASVN